MVKTIGVLLEEARRRSGAQKLLGHDILDLARFDTRTRHMVVFVVISDESPFGFKGDKMRLFLSEEGYRNVLDSQTQGGIEIKNHAAVLDGHLFYDELGHDL